MAYNEPQVGKSLMIADDLLEDGDTYNLICSKPECKNKVFTYDGKDLCCQKCNLKFPLDTNAAVNWTYVYTEG
jgi:hypothetical protein